MRFIHSLASGLFLLLLGCQASTDRPLTMELENKTSIAPSLAIANTFQLPFLFEKSDFRDARGAQYVVNRPGHNLIVESNALVSVLGDSSQNANKVGALWEPRLSTQSVLTLRLKFTGASETVKIIPEKESSVPVNYYTGSVESDWRRDVSAYSSLRHKELYPETDMVLTSDQGKFSYYFEIRPGGEVSNLNFEFEGADRVEIAESGDLEITLSNGKSIVHRAPRAFDSLGDDQREVQVQFTKRGRYSIGFETERHREGSTLTIDPVIDFGTYFGGTSWDVINLGTYNLELPALDIAVDDEGRLLIAGGTRSVDLRNATGPVTGSSGMAFVARLDVNHPSGPRYDYLNYFSGDGFDAATAVSPGGNGRAYVCGRTNSADFPIQGNAFDTSAPSGRTGFVMLLDNSGQLRTTSFIDVSDDTSIFDCAFSESYLNIPAGLYFTGWAFGVEGPGPLPPNFVTPGAPQTDLTGLGDAMIGKLTPDLGGLEYFTLAGGSYSDWGLGIAVHEGSAVITGWAESPDFPLTVGAYAGAHTLTDEQAEVCDNPSHTHQCWETFVTKVNPAGDGFDISTFLGDPMGDFASGIAVDPDFNIYIAGQRVRTGAAREAFTVKLSASGNLVNRVNFGGSGARAFDVAVDSNRVVHLIGQTQLNGQATGFPVDPSANGDMDGFYATLDPSGTLDYFTYLGGSEFDAGYTLAVESDTCVYLGLETWSDVLDIPIPGAPQSTRAGSNDALLLRHCRGEIDGGEPPDPILTKEMIGGISQPGDLVFIRLLVDNPGTWRPGMFTLQDIVAPVPFEVLGAIGRACTTTGQTVECIWNGLPSGTSSVLVMARNRLNCQMLGDVEVHDNTARFFLPNGDFVSSTFPMPYVACDDISDGPCGSSEQCPGDQLCVAECVPMNRRETQHIIAQPYCLPPEVVDGCDRVLP